MQEQLTSPGGRRVGEQVPRTPITTASNQARPSDTVMTLVCGSFKQGFRYRLRPTLIVIKTTPGPLPADFQTPWARQTQWVMEALRRCRVHRYATVAHAPAEHHACPSGASQAGDDVSADGGGGSGRRRALRDAQPLGDALARGGTPHGPPRYSALRLGLPSRLDRAPACNGVPARSVAARSAAGAGRHASGGAAALPACIRGALCGAALL